MSGDLVQSRRLSMGLKDALDALVRGDYVRPDFQREFVWTADLVRELLWSIFHGYPVGSLLLWRAIDEDGSDHRFDELHCKPLDGFPAGQAPERTHIVLDGQQRLTALYYAFIGSSIPIAYGRNQSRKVLEFFIRLDHFDKETKELRHKTSIGYREPNIIDMRDSSSIESGKLDAIWLDDITRHQFPLRLIGVDSLDHNTQAFLMRYKRYWEDQWLEADAEVHEHEGSGDRRSKQYNAAVQRFADADDAIKVADSFKNHLDRILDYRLQWLELPAGSKRRTVREMFMQINRHGKQLTGFELYNAELSLNTRNPQDFLDAMRESLRDSLGEDKEDQDIQSKSKLVDKELAKHIGEIILLRATPKGQIPPSDTEEGDFPWDPYLFPSQLRTDTGSYIQEDDLSKGLQSLEHLFNSAGKELAKGIRSLRTEAYYGALPRAEYDEFAPYQEMLPVLSALLADAARLASDDQASQGRRAHTQSLKRIQQWYWANALAGQYKQRNRSGRHEDYHAVIKWLSDRSGKDNIPRSVREFKNKFDRGALGDAVWISESHSATVVAIEPLFATVLNFMNLAKPVDLLSGMSAGDSVPITPCLIVPRNWGDEREIDDRKLWSAFNHWLITPDMQRFIGEDMPYQWLPRLEQKQRSAGWSLEKIEGAWRSHDISLTALERLRRRNFDEADFKDFMAEREFALLRRLGDLFDTEFNVPWQHRKLHRRAIRIEGELRKAIARVYAGDKRRDLPGLFKVNDVRDRNGVEVNLRDEANKLAREREDIHQALDDLMALCSMGDFAWISRHPKHYGTLTSGQASSGNRELGPYSNARNLDADRYQLADDIIRVKQVRDKLGHALGDNLTRIQLDEAETAIRKLHAWLGLQ